MRVYLTRINLTAISSSNICSCSNLVSSARLTSEFLLSFSFQLRLDEGRRVLLRESEDMYSKEQLGVKDSCDMFG